MNEVQSRNLFFQACVNGYGGVCQKAAHMHCHCFGRTPQISQNRVAGPMPHRLQRTGRSLVLNSGSPSAQCTVDGQLWSYISEIGIILISPHSCKVSFRPLSPTLHVNDRRSRTRVREACEQKKSGERAKNTHPPDHGLRGPARGVPAEGGRSPASPERDGLDRTRN